MQVCLMQCELRILKGEKLYNSLLKIEEWKADTVLNEEGKVFCLQHDRSVGRKMVGISLMEQWIWGALVGTYWTN